MNGRRPFEKDHAIFNYEYDSEGEWEEGDGEGERKIHPTLHPTFTVTPHLTALHHYHTPHPTHTTPPHTDSR